MWIAYGWQPRAHRSLCSSWQLWNRWNNPSTGWTSTRQLWWWRSLLVLLIGLSSRSPWPWYTGQTAIPVMWSKSQKFESGASSYRKTLNQGRYRPLSWVKNTLKYLVSGSVSVLCAISVDKGSVKVCWDVYCKLCGVCHPPEIIFTTSFSSPSHPLTTFNMNLQ